MPPSQLPPGFLTRFKTMENEIARLKGVSKAHTETKTLVVPASAGTIDDTFDIPRIGVRINGDGKSVEWKQIIGFGGEVGTGAVTVEWQLDGTPIGTFTALDTVWTTTMLTTPVDLPYVAADNGSHQLKPVVQTGSSATGGMSLEFIMSTGRR